MMNIRRSSSAKCTTFIMSCLLRDCICLHDLALIIKDSSLSSPLSSNKIRKQIDKACQFVSSLKSRLDILVNKMVEIQLEVSDKIMRFQQMKEICEPKSDSLDVFESEYDLLNSEIQNFKYMKKANDPPYSNEELIILAQCYPYSGCEVQHSSITFTLTNLRNPLLSLLSQKKIEKIKEVTINFPKHFERDLSTFTENIEIDEIPNLTLCFTNSYLSKYIQALLALLEKVSEKVTFRTALIEIDQDLPRLIENCSHIPTLIFNDCIISKYGEIKCNNVEDPKLSSVVFNSCKFWTKSTDELIEMFNCDSMPTSIKKIYLEMMIGYLRNKVKGNITFFY